MKANCFVAPNKVEVRDFPDPQLLNARDCIVKITSTAICGSDLHLVDGYVPAMESGDILGHEFMGEVVDVGAGAKHKLKVGDRVVVPFPISCGNCGACKAQAYSLCENSNPNAWMAEKMWGHSPAGVFGYSHLTGGFAGGQAEYARVPFADVGPFKVDSTFTDEQVLFLSDILPTGYMAAEMCDIKPGAVIAIWGAGPVGLFAAQSAFVLGAERVIVIDHYDYRLKKAQELGCEVLNFDQVDILDALKEMTGGRGPDSCIDAVGLEATGHGPLYMVDRLKHATRMESDRPIAVREAIMSCRNGGTVSIIGVYGGVVDHFPLGALMNRSLTIKTGQCHVHRYMQPLLELIGEGKLDPLHVITHRMPLADAARGYDMFKHKKDCCEKVVLKAS